MAAWEARGGKIRFCRAGAGAVSGDSAPGRWPAPGGWPSPPSASVCACRVHVGAGLCLQAVARVLLYAVIMGDMEAVSGLFRALSVPIPAYNDGYTRICCVVRVGCAGRCGVGARGAGAAGGARGCGRQAGGSLCRIAVIYCCPRNFHEHF